MLRNVCRLQLLRQLKQTVAPPGVSETTTSAATWCRCYTPQPTSAEVTSDGIKNKSQQRKAPKQPRSKKVTPKGKQLHHRLLSNDEITEQTQMRQQLDDQPEEELFGTRHLHKQIERNQRQREKFPPRDQRFKGSVSDKRHGVGERGVKGSPKEKVDSVKFSSEVTGEETEQWNDMFGTMADPKDLKLTSELEKESAERAATDKDGEDDHVPLREFSKDGHSVFWYGRQIEKLGKQGKVYEAIQMLEKTMLQEDRVAPNQYVFTVLIGICGRAGYTKKAFSLFNKMKKYGLEPEMPTYTALFNAFANSPWKGDGLRRTNHLLQHIKEKDIELNTTNMKAVIKAYGRLGELQTAFGIVDKMLEGGHVIDAEVWSHLLMACVSDKEAGLNHAIQVWRLMRRKKVPFDIYHYNLLLRAARDCGVGDEKFANQLLGGSADNNSPESQNQIAGSSGNRPQQNKQWWEEEEIKYVPEVAKSKLEITTKEVPPLSAMPLDIGDHSKSISLLDSHVPNILNPRGLWRRGALGVMSLGNLDSPDKRLALLGGLPGVLSHMDRDNVRPDIKTFSQLLDMVPMEDAAEEDLLTTMKTWGVVPDADLLNQVIRRRCQKGKGLNSALEVLPLFGQYELVPNLMTYASLALGCYNYLTGLKLLDDMQAAGFEPTTDIFGILLRRSTHDFRYKMALCKQMQKTGILPNAKIIEYLEKVVASARRNIVLMERGESVPAYFRRPEFPEEFKQFMLFYKPWLLNSRLEKEEHPWAQYRRPTGGEQTTSESTETEI